ncbi:MAG: hypothetical protein ACFE8G_14635 [Candidatus Hermodarchaeota archaeon]
MNDNRRDKYKILDPIFTVLNTLSMVLTAVFLLNNLIVSLIFIVIVVLFGILVIFLWISRNPFNIYLVRAISFNNFIFTLLALSLYYSQLSPTLPEYPLGYIFLLFPSGIYFLITFKLSGYSNTVDKKQSAILTYTGRSKAAEQHLFKSSLEERMRREEVIAKQKNIYRYKLIITLVIILTLTCFAAIIYSFY